MKMTEREILPGITLSVIETDRFKTCALNVSFLTPLRRETASANALVPYVLRRGCARLSDLAKLNAELDSLYGASIEPFVYQQGDVQYVGFWCDGISDVFAAGADSVSQALFSLVQELICTPVLQDGCFVEEYVQGEKENLIQAILSEKNEKLSYAYQSATRALFSKQCFGLSALGELKYAKMLTNKEVYSAYCTLLKRAPLKITYCGSESFDAVSERVKTVFATLKREITDSARVSAPAFSDEVLNREEIMDVAQTVLLIGFRTDADEIPLKVLSAILGGSTASKLFLNVRERASLCYYTGSVFNPRQNTIFLYAGVEDEKETQAYERMMQQFDACARGEITEEELERGKQTLINRLRTINDTGGALLSYWVDQAVDGNKMSPGETEQAIRAVTRRQLIDAAKGCEQKIVYRLCGKEAQKDARKLLQEHQ